MTYSRDSLPANFRSIPSQADLVFEGEIFSVYQWQQEMFDGSHEIFEMLRRPDTVIVLAIDDDGRVIVNDEEQPGGIFRTNHLPAGRVDQEDDSPLVAARRELLEETGWRFETWDLLEVVQPESKIDWLIYLFLARDPVGRIEPSLDVGEKITTKSVPLADVGRSGLMKGFSYLNNISSVEELAARVNSRP